MNHSKCVNQMPTAPAHKTDGGDGNNGGDSSGNDDFDGGSSNRS